MRTNISGGIDPLRAEFVRSALGVIAGSDTEIIAADILFAFIKGTSQTPLKGASEEALRRFLVNACNSCAADKAEIESFVMRIAAVAAAASNGQPDIFDKLTEAEDS